MNCPKCGTPARGKWCENCGTRLEIDENYNLNPYETTTDTPPIKETYPKNSNDNYRGGNIPRDRSPYDGNEQYTEDEYENKGKNTALIVALCVGCVAVVAFIVTAIIFFSWGSDKDVAVDSAAVEDQQIQELTKKGEKYMNIGDYESAEGIYRQIIDMTDDEEAIIVYKILFNYNRAAESIDEQDFEEALKYFNKIPDEYVDYIIFDDIEVLSEEISRYETAYEIFESIEKFMAAKDYDAAKEAIDIIDESALSKEAKEALSQFKKEIEENEKPEIVLSEHDAENLLMGCCEALEEAVNTKNFDKAAAYMYKGSDIYKEQKGLVEHYISQNIRKSFDSFKLISLTKQSDTSWQARVVESETLIYEGDVSESKTYNWTYTIEYIDSSFYLTKVK